MSAAASHTVYRMEDPSQVGEARRAAVRLAEQRGFDEVESGRLALVVTELGTNLVRHASGGRLLIAPIWNEGRDAVEVLSLDEGPGMADVWKCLGDGYSTSGTSGSGLGAVRRLADEFDVYSSAPGGTVAAARVARRAEAGSRPAVAPAGMPVAVVALNAPGEIVCGDACSFVQRDGEAALMVVDGLGHGPEASAAARVAVDRFETDPFASPARMLEAAHALMRATRGAAAATARLDAAGGTVTFCGAGNVVGRVVSGVEDRTLLSQHGTLGLQIRKLQDAVYPWPEHAIVVLHTDGIVTRWDLALAPGLLQCHPAVIAGWLIRGHLRGKDDATVVVIRRT